MAVASYNSRKKYIGGSNDGFTFIEMIAVMALMGILTAIFGMGLVSAMQSYDFSRANVQTAQKAQAAMSRIARELAELTKILNVQTGQNPFIVYERIQDEGGVPTSIRLGLHFNRQDRTVRLCTDPADDLNAMPLAQGDVLVDGVREFSLDYFQGNNSLAWEFDSTLLSTIQITLELVRPENPSRTKNFVTLVHMRNNHNEGGAAP